ncbi:unnamed protein product [Phyllotreta striolata]|uniref:Ig-like domain-containing protein n=1 Tax=Phyllotreta striolata TaxID=444603 RepID=A0A9N9TU83_PHYSR|nr:unnamed protein product [Phyllotreta striolata]
MIVGVCWRVCLLIVVCRCRSVLDEDYSNDYPSFDLQPQIKTIKVKSGTRYTLRCHHDDVQWLFKPCDSNFSGTIICDDNRKWKKIENVTSGRLHIGSASRKHKGLYRCLQRNGTVRRFKLNVYEPLYTGSPPTVSPLQISNITGPINMEFTIQCRVTSEVPPTIIWFKSCYGQKCDFRYHQTCYCHINTSISNHNTGTTYLSKYLIFDARDVDAGTYVCLAVNQFGKDDRNVTVAVPAKADRDVYSLLFLVPFGLLLVPLVAWLCYFEKRKRSPEVVVVVDQQKRLIRPVGPVNEIV